MTGPGHRAKRREYGAGPNRTRQSGTDADDQPRHRAKRREYGAGPDGTNAHGKAKRHGIAALQ